MDDVLDEMMESIDNRDELGNVELSHGEKCLLFVIATFEKLHTLGLVTEGPWTLNLSDEKVKELLGEDFKPTPEEIQDVILWMKEEGYAE